MKRFISWLKDPPDELLKNLTSFTNSDLAQSKSLEYRATLESFCRSSFDLDDREKMLLFVGENMNSDNWRKVYNSIIIIEGIFTKGSKTVVAECHAGRHFDVLQRLSILQSYSNPDGRIQNLIQEAAKAARTKVKDRFAEEEEKVEVKVTELAGKPRQMKGAVYLNHQEDTSDEEEVKPAGEPVRSPVKYSNLIDLL